MAKMDTDPEAAAALALLEQSGLIGPGSAKVGWHRDMRHRVTCVETEDGHGNRSLIVKRCGSPMGGKVLSLAGEIAFHDWVSGEDACDWFRPHLPDLLYTARDRSWLVYAAATDRRPLSDLTVAPAEVRTAVMTRMGSLLADLHGLPLPTPAQFPDASVSVQTFGRLSPEIIVEHSPAFMELAKLVQSRPDLNDALRDLRNSARRIAVTHGDLKCDNILFDPDGTLCSPVILDWECVAIGDPAWDCGSVIGSSAFAWSTFLGSETHSSDLLVLSHRMLTDIGAFLNAYTAGRAGEPSFDAGDEIGRALRWAGYWLIGTILATLPTRRVLSAQDVSLLQIADELMTVGSPQHTVDSGRFGHAPRGRTMAEIRAPA